MLHLFRPSEEKQRFILRSAVDAPACSPCMLSLEKGLIDMLPTGFVHDVSKSFLGRGRSVFEAARQGLLSWEQFNLGWVRVVNRDATITPGQVVAVEAHTAFLWSTNLSRIVETLDNPDHFGFLYTTTAIHVEEGQERFVIHFDPATQLVSYLIEAVSRPRHQLARMAYSFSRSMQRRFAKDSHARMKQLCASRAT